MSLLELSLFVHITAVVVGFGSTFAEALMFPVALKLDNRHLPYVHKLQLAINQRFATPALVLVLITGLYQTSEGGYSLGDLWISATLVIVIALGGLIGGYFIPTDRRLGPMAERELATGAGEMSAEYQRSARGEGIAGGIAGVLIVIAIFLMVVKPGG